MSTKHQVMSLRGNKKMTVTLGDDNFIQWEFELKGILVMVEQLEYVTGLLPGGGVTTRSSSSSSPTPEEVLEQQRTLRWLYVVMVEAISLPIRRLITTIPAGDARALFQTLKTHFIGRSRAMVSSLSERFINMRLKNAKDFPGYAEDVKEMAARLTELGEDVSEKQTLRTLLRGLGPEFRTIRLFLEANEVEDLAKVIRIIKESMDYSPDLYRNHGSNTSGRNDQAPKQRQEGALNVKEASYSNKAAKIKCFSCQQLGHYASKCPSKQQPPRNGIPSGSKSSKVCNYCQKLGHLEEECHKKKREKANIVTDDSNEYTFMAIGQLVFNGGRGKSGNNGDEEVSIGILEVESKTANSDLCPGGADNDPELFRAFWVSQIFSEKSFTLFWRIFRGFSHTCFRACYGSLSRAWRQLGFGQRCYFPYGQQPRKFY